MHKILLLLLACTIALSGCANTAQIEALAFAEILGVDLNDQGSIEVCIEIPKISGQRGESSSGGSKGASNLV